MRIFYFPVNKIQKGSRIAVYGNGRYGKMLTEWNFMFQYCDIKFIIDRSAGINQNAIKICRIEEVTDWDVDYILLASKKYEKEYIDELSKYNFPVSKIVCLNESACVFDDENNIGETATELGGNDYWGENGLDWYRKAEADASNTFQVLKPFFEEYMEEYAKKTWLDFGCGEGRIVNLLKDQVKEIYCCDISEAAVSKCRKRFAADKNVKSFVNEKNKLPIDENLIDFIFSVGTMVHFDLREMHCFLNEFYRVLKIKGYCILHHSNWRRTSGYFETDSTHSKGYYRGDVSADDVAKLAQDIGFKVLEQKVIPWGNVTEHIDCITVLHKG